MNVSSTVRGKSAIIKIKVLDLHLTTMVRALPKSTGAICQYLPEVKNEQNCTNQMTDPRNRQGPHSDEAGANHKVPDWWKRRPVILDALKSPCR